MSEMRDCAYYFKEKDNELFSIFKEEANRASKEICDQLAKEIKKRSLKWKQ